MQSFRRHIRPVSIIVLLLMCAGCTDNPFESDPTIAASKRRIAGVVRLSDRSDHSGAYIWMEGFDIGSVTRSDGSFSLTLPPASAQSTPGGNEGVFRIFAFLGNYRLQSVKTAVHDGAFVFPSTEVGEDGHIHEDLFLQELFSITTDLSRSSIEADSPRTLTVTVTLRSSVPPVEVYYPRMVDGVEGPMLLHNLGTGEVEIYKSTVTGVEIVDNIELGPFAYSRSMLLNIPRYKLKAGEYEIIPYILPRNRVIPNGLLASLGTDISACSGSYVYYPFLRSGGRLRVEPN